MQPTREQAWEWLKEYTKSEALRRHALTVEGCMRHFAALAGEDAELWGVVGLLHDLDYEQYPDEHCKKVQEILRERTSIPRSSARWPATALAFAATSSPRAGWRRRSTPSTS